MATLGSIYVDSAGSARRRARVDAKPPWERWSRRLAEGILSGELIVTTLCNGALVTSPNGSYFANGSCECAAAQNGHRECKHRAAARLIDMYEAAPEVEPKPARARRQPEITRSVERDRLGRRHLVVRCDGWAI
jgi:hypothetical protein